MSNGGSRSDGMRDVSHLHNDTSSSVNSTGWTGCQGKDQKISIFSGGRMVSW